MKNKEWQLQEAKNRLSQVVCDARDKGPQTITVRGKPQVVVLGMDDYKRLTRAGTSLSSFLRDSPLGGLEFPRSKDAGRDASL